MIIVGYFFTSLLAMYEAHMDYCTIIRHQYINHTWEWIQRAVMTVIMISLLILTKVLSSWSSVVLLSIAAPPIFSIVHRVCLNNLRNQKYYYISPSNVYDLFWICVAALIKHKQWDNPFDTTTKAVYKIKQIAGVGNTQSEYYKLMKFGAHLAYIVELVVVIAALAINTF